jgi:hypothetical protein
LAHSRIISITSSVTKNNTVKDFINGMREQDEMKNAEIKLFIDGKEITDPEKLPFETIMNMSIRISKNEDTKDLPPKASYTVTVLPLEDAEKEQPTAPSGQ